MPSELDDKEEKNLCDKNGMILEFDSHWPVLLIGLLYGLIVEFLRKSLI